MAERKHKKESNKFKNPNAYQQTVNFSKEKENKYKNKDFMDKVNEWTSFYREYPFVFAEHFLNLNLKLFQKILLFCMFHFYFFMFIASRGLGKSWLTSVFCCCKALLYPNCQIVVASGNLKQATVIIKYIKKMREDSECLDISIKYLNDGVNNAKVEFWNGSSILVVASNEGARSGRANVLIVDEFILVDKGTITTVLRKFKANPRQAKYLNKQEYKHLTERNQEIYLSSAGKKWHWGWEKYKSFFNAMMNGKKYLVCNLPYQLTIKEGLRMREEVLDEMAEDDFDPISWRTEMEGIWLGENADSYFKFDDLEPNRKISIPVYPEPYFDNLKTSNFKYIPKKNGEIRILSADIALMDGKENDSSIYCMVRLIPSSSKKFYIREYSYMESMMGGHSTTQAIRIRQLYDDLDCDYICLDTSGNGISVYDNLCQELFDKERGVEYNALSCMNDEKMASRCLVSGSPKKIYSMKANAVINSDCATSFKDTLRKNKIKLLINENEGREILSKVKGFESLPIEIQARFINTYIQISSLINEMIELEGSVTDNGIKLKESGGKRKDRWSCIAYANYFANTLERDLLINDKYDEDDDSIVLY